MKIICALFISIVFLTEGYTQTNEDKGISFDSLLILKGKQSLGKKFKPFHRTRYAFSFNKKITYVNFWFATCLPCIAEIKSLNELYYKLKSNKNFQFISVTFENKKEIEKFRNKYSIPYKIYSVSKDECYRLNEGSGFPTSVIVDENGIIKFLLSGYETNPKKAHKIIFNTIYPKILSELQQLKNHP